MIFKSFVVSKIFSLLTHFDSCRSKLLNREVDLNLLTVFRRKTSQCNMNSRLPAGCKKIILFCSTSSGLILHPRCPDTSSQFSKLPLNIMKILTHPEVIHDLDSLLKIYGDVHGDVVVEAGTHGELLREGRPVVFPA